MIVTADPGPVGSPTAADAVGVRAETALLYVGTAGERTEVPLPLLPGCEQLRGRTIAIGEVLRWYVHPVLDAQQTWGATHVAVDLVLDDGTRASEHALRDQYGTLATAEGLGAGRILYADQWNDVQVDLAALAGRTITEVLMLLDAPPDPEADLLEDRDLRAPAPPAEAATRELHGWIDGPYLETPPADPPVEDPVAWVDTRRGTHSSRDFSRGGTLPLTGLPNGFALCTPVTDARTSSRMYEYRRGGGPEGRPGLQSLALTHHSGPGRSDGHRLLLMPLLGAEPDASPSARQRGFDHAAETARPDQYEVALDGGLRLRLAPTDHGAICEIDLPADADDAHLLLEGLDERARPDAAGAVFDGSLHGWVDAPGNDGASRMFVRAGTEPAPLAVGPARGDSHGSVLSFAPGTRRITVRLATSCIGREQARRTFDQELTGRSFTEVRETAHAAWAARLRVIEVPEATAPQRRTLLGSLYRMNLFPSSHWEDRGTNQRPEPVHAGPVLPRKGDATATRTNAQVLPGRMYVGHDFRDTARTVWPAYALLYPQLAAELADGFVQQHREGGGVDPRSSPGTAERMLATAGGDIALADLAVKGVPLPDARAAYESGLRNATVAPPGTEVGGRGDGTAVFTGFLPASIPESVSRTLEGHLGDAGLAALAGLLAERSAAEGDDAAAAQLREESHYLRARSQNYALLFDASIEFFQGRNPGGDFARSPAEFDPRRWGEDFAGTDGWNAAFHVPHDGGGLAALYGGPEMLRGRLEEFLATPERADRPGDHGEVTHEMREARAVRMGQLDMSHQSCRHIPVLFHHVGAPEEASRIVREVHRRLFVGEQIGQGYPGDDGPGALSAWWLLTALGLYPLQLASGRYHLLAPLFPRVGVHPLGGEPFTITSDATGPQDACITAMTVDGREHTASWIDHAALRGRIHVTVAAEPAGWGTQPPPSPSSPERPPQLLRDLFAADPSEPLLDDDARTERAFDTASAVLALPVLGEPLQARFLTLTSAAAAGGDPIAWRLEGSDDGTAWEILDARSAQTFRWRRQTRPFEIASPRPCRHHRLVVTTAEGPLRLAEVELLA